MAVFTALLFGLVPALQVARRDLAAPLKDTGKGAAGGFRRGALRSSLVVVEVALSLLLLVGAGLLMRTFSALQSVDLGFNPENIVVARIPFPRGQYRAATDKQRYFRELLSRLHALPGVMAAAETTTLPPYGGIQSEIEIPGKSQGETSRAIFQLCSEGYFPTLQLRLARGRLLSEVEVNDARRVAVINQALAKKYFGTDDPIGARIKIKFLETMPDSPVADPVFEVIGIIADAKNRGIQEAPGPEMFIPYTVTGAFERGILVRTSGNPLLLLDSVKREIWAGDRNIALTLSGTLKGYLAQFSYAEPRFTLMLLGVFAGVGLVLVAVGVWSVIAYTVSRRTAEIGIRVALGAQRTDVLRMVLGSGMRLIGAGITAGILASLAVTRLIASQLWSISPRDPATFGGVAAVVALAGVAACYFPARRATRVDPVVALRHE
jgi:putative ABC transport system permease protein